MSRAVHSQIASFRGVDWLLNRTNMLWGSEIGNWKFDGKPTVDTATTIPASVRAAKISNIRFAIGDVFTDMLDPLGGAGTLLRSDFDAALDGILHACGAFPWIKLLPIENVTEFTKSGTIFCPPKGAGAGTATNLTMDLYIYKEVVRQAGSRVQLYESNNEMEFDCANSVWGFTNGASVGVSTILGNHFAQNMPVLRKYARSLGWDIATMGYFGVAGGTQWGDSPASPRTSNFQEFMTATHNAYVSAGNDPDYIPDIVSLHCYPFGTGADFFNTDTIATVIAYYNALFPAMRTVMVNTWGATIGNKMKIAVSEWNCGNTSWTGWGTSAVVDMINAFVPMMQQNGIWMSNIFALASNSTQPYDMIKEDGTFRDQYAPWKALSLAAQP